MPKGNKKNNVHGHLLKRRDEIDDVEEEQSSDISDDQFAGESCSSLNDDCCCRNNSKCKCSSAATGSCVVKKGDHNNKFTAKLKKERHQSSGLVSGWDATDDLTTRRQKLELQLSKAQVEEAHHNDRHDLLQLKFERIERLMQSTVQYLDCIQLESRASQRFCQSLNSLIVNEKSIVLTENLSALIRKFCDKPSCTTNNVVKEKVLKALSGGGGGGDNLEELSHNYDERKRDFNVASQNFKMLLQNAPNLNLGQMEKLQHQFESILLSFQHSRCMLDQQVPNVTSYRMQILLDCFKRLGSDLNSVASDRLDLSSVLDHLGSSLRACGGDLPGIEGVPLAGNSSCNNCSKNPSANED